MTGCFKLVSALQQQSGLSPAIHCSPCVYFSKNLDKAEFPVLIEKPDHCGLGFLPSDGDCVEMRTDNCSTRISKS